MKLASLMVSLMALAFGLPAQTFHLLYSFPNFGDGGRPETTMLLSGNTLYGTAQSGGIFKVGTDGTGFAVLHRFPTTGYYGDGEPGELSLSGSTLYGMTPYSTGGLYTAIIFKMGTDGSNYTELTNIVGNNVNYPMAGLLLLGDTLYGTTGFGASWSNDVGIVFKVGTNGSGYEVLHRFAAVDSSQHNSEGAYPLAGLASDGGTLFGTTGGGGSNGYGTVFKINMDNNAFTVLHRFTLTDGVSPWGRLLLRGDTLYGTTAGGGSGTLGTVFKVDTNGNGFTVLYDIPTDNPTTCLNCGARGGLVLSGNTLYGTCQNEGNFLSTGNIFKVNTDGSGFAKLYVFSLPSPWNTNFDGDLPLGGLVMSGNALYGTAAVHGPSNHGTVFGLELPCSDCPPVISSITQTNGALAFTWSANAGGSYQVQYTTDARATNWNDLGGVLVATNSTLSAADIIGPEAQRFYRVVLLAP